MDRTSNVRNLDRIDESRLQHSMALLLMGESINGRHRVVRRSHVSLHCRQELLGRTHTRNVHANGHDDVYTKRSHWIRLTEECLSYRSNRHLDLPASSILQRSSQSKSGTDSVRRRHYRLGRSKQNNYLTEKSNLLSFDSAGFCMQIYSCVTLLAE